MVVKPQRGTEDLQKIYVVRNRDEVTQFLRDSPFLLPVLKEAPGKIRKHFGDAAQLVLDLLTDPEIAGEKELVIFVVTGLPPDEALDRLDMVDEEWWLDTDVAVRKTMNISLQFL